MGLFCFILTLHDVNNIVKRMDERFSQKKFKETESKRGIEPERPANLVENRFYMFTSKENGQESQGRFTGIYRVDNGVKFPLFEVRIGDKMVRKEAVPNTAREYISRVRGLKKS